MLRIVLILCMLFVNLLPVPAEEQVKETFNLKGQVEYDDNLIETIYLDDKVEKPEVNIPQHSLTLPVGVLNITSNTNTMRSALARTAVNRNNVSDIVPLSGSVVAHAGGFSYGSRYDQEISYSQLESTTAFFLRYDSKKRFSFDTAFRQSANRDIDNQYSSVRVTPEWHITNRLTLKDSFTNYIQSQKNKNSITIVYTPILKKYADALKFELGIAQSYYANGNQSAEVSFSTGFRL